MTYRVIHLADFGGANIEGTRSQSLTHTAQVARPLTDGSPVPSTAHLMSESAAFSVETIDLAAGLTATGAQGSEQTSVIIYDATMDESGAKASGSVHRSATLGNAYVLPNSISGAHRSLASMTCTAIGYSTDGSTPVAYAGSVALPSLSGSPNSYGLGVVEVNGTAISQKTRVQIDFGLSTASDQFDDNIADGEVVVVSVLPMITISTTDTSVASTIGRALAGDGANGCEVWFYQRSTTGFASGSNHVKISATDGVFTPLGISGTPREYSFKFEPSSGLTVATSAAAPS